MKKIIERNSWGLEKTNSATSSPINCWNGFKWNCCGSVFRKRKIGDRVAATTTKTIAGKVAATPVVSVNVLPVDSNK